MTKKKSDDLVLLANIQSYCDSIAVCAQQHYNLPFIETEKAALRHVENCLKMFDEAYRNKCKGKKYD